MPENEARAWWADVQHVRESIERRRGGVAEAPAPVAPPEPTPTGRFTRAAAEPPIPRLDDLDWPPDLPLRGRRFERAPRADVAADDARSAAARATDTLEVAPPHTSAASPREIRVTTADTESAPDPLELDLSGALAPPVAPPVRRTVQITGRTVAAPALPRLVEVERRRPARRPVERIGPRPDRIALYAVLLGFFLILVAAAS